MGIADEKYVAFTTFRRTGLEVTSPVWIAPLGPGQAGFSTGASSGKAKRLAHTDTVRLQPCNQRGTPRHGSVQITARARIVLQSDPEFNRVVEAISGKYQVGTRFISAIGTLKRVVRPSEPPMAPNAAVVIDLE
ncbi:MAG: PPOX class F420-dependent oxidoreductase [Ornithinimicrobium sp.]